MNARRKCPDYYSEEEIIKIRNQWRTDKKRVDLKMKGAYPRDIDHAYQKYLNNKNLSVLFRHAIFLYWGGIVEGELFLYPNEKDLVIKVYKEIKKNGYYSKSKKEEEKIRAHFGKAVSRQYFRKYRK